jgi:asparagine synthase (glutamine-hydrolysing)
MCGISGFIYHDSQRSIDAESLARMQLIQRHRGPDDNGTWIDGNVGLAFNRLAIIDLSGGHQPMLNSSSSVCLVFNGEIYNFRELRTTLQDLGCNFQTSSDTEVILHAWEQWGERCVEHLRGMFAFVLWDRRIKVLFGARDRLGIKPLYYHHGPQGFAFASEIKSLLECDWIPRRIDDIAIGEYLRHRYVITPRTILRDVRKLPPAHYFIVKDSQLAVKRYWDLKPKALSAVDKEEALEGFKTAMSEVIRQHLISDVPLGAFLSGGLDSSSVVAWMAHAGVSAIKTFSIGFDSPESELPFARRVAKHLGTEHHELVLQSVDFQEMFDRIVWFMDEPVGDEASLPLYFLAQFARQSVTVALSGEGSDELFAGYNYRPYARNAAMQALPGVKMGSKLTSIVPIPKLRRFAKRLATPLERQYRGVSRVFEDIEATKLFPLAAECTSRTVDETYQRCPASDPLHRMLYLDLNTWLPDDLLVKADRMSMAHSLELRVPFLDHEVVEFVWQLPSDLKIREETSKYLLKESVKDLLPADIIHRTKMGFPVPLQSWFRQDLAGFARETLLQTQGITDILDRSTLEQVLAAHQYQDRSQQIYALLVLGSWIRQYIHRD